MQRRRSRRHVVGLLWLSVLTVEAFAAERGRRAPLDVCISAVQAHFELFRFDEKVVARQCQCVRGRRPGKLPRTMAEWTNTGKRSANLAYVECAQSEIVSFYSGVVLKSEMATLAKEGLAQVEREVQMAEDFSACVGEGSCNEARRVAATAPTQSGRLDKPKFLEMYGRCVAAKDLT